MAALQGLSQRPTPHTSRPQTNYNKGVLIGGGVGLAVGLGLGAVADGFSQSVWDQPGGCESILATSRPVGAVFGWVLVQE